MPTSSFTVIGTCCIYLTPFRGRSEIAIVRAVNPDTGIIYLTTGVNPDVLPKVNALLRGRVDLPQALFVEQETCAIERPYNVSLSEKYLELAFSGILAEPAHELVSKSQETVDSRVGIVLTAGPKIR
ncbi:unnamed protein product [Dibothriocephalus latus]|uniref:Uncharacterized protein n=1 Tax=Dibothriocephalus latus TaxID=60516 RepID=A0A3P6Q338_DIBLA|nr:unnamed protein product [Dibothriocephalus latus]